MTCQFISEVSSNHEKDIKRCFDFIDTSAAIGCDAVKFQLFRIKDLFSEEALIAKPELRERVHWELPTSFLGPIADRCKERKIDFCCTPFDIDAVEKLRPYVSFYKIASYELLWLDLIKACAKTQKPLVLSTGMATMQEINSAVRCAMENGCSDITVLHCVSSYPTPINQCNLSNIKRLRQELPCKVGWSDHTVSAEVLNRALHKWNASTIEFHLDLDGRGAEYKTGHCWLPAQMKEVILKYKTSLLADGDCYTELAEAEAEDRDWRADPSDGLRPLKETREKLRDARINRG